MRTITIYLNKKDNFDKEILEIFNYIKSKIRKNIIVRGDTQTIKTSLKDFLTKNSGVASHILLSGFSRNKNVDSDKSKIVIKKGFSSVVLDAEISFNNDYAKNEVEKNIKYGKIGYLVKTFGNMDDDKIYNLFDKIINDM